MEPLDDSYGSARGGSGSGAGLPLPFKLASIGLFIGLFGLVWWAFLATRPDAVRRALTGGCSEEVTKEELISSLRLGTDYLLRHQTAAGVFDYEYDWRTGKLTTADNAVHQAAAVWGLATLFQFEGPPKPVSALAEATGRGLRFFDAEARVGDGGGRFPIYRGGGGMARGEVGTAAFLTLAIIDYLRALPRANVAERDYWGPRLKAYLSFLETARAPDGLWFSAFDHKTGVPEGNHSPHADGEALLALVMAAKYMGRDDLRPLARQAAADGHRLNIVDALNENADSEVTKAYYEGAALAYYELATSSWASDGPYRSWLFGLTDWMVDVHQTLARPHNTAYAYEGIVPAYALALAAGDEDRAKKLGCVAHAGMAKLLSGQLGHARAKGIGLDSPAEAKGGVQNEANDAKLRIDVLQHQMRAGLLAVRLLFPPAPIDQ